MHKKAIIPVIAMLAMVFTVSTALAGNHGYGRHGGGMGPGYMGQGPGCWQGYSQNLTDEQRNTLSTLQQEHFQAMNGLRVQMFEKRAELDRLLSNPESDRAAINKAMDALNDVRNKMMNERLDYEKKLADAGIDTQFGRGGPGYAPCGYGGCPGGGHGRGHGWGHGQGYDPGCPGQGYGRGPGFGPHHMGPRTW